MSATKADYIFRVGNGTELVNPIVVTAGQEAVIGVWAVEDDGPFQGYDLSFDFGGDGFGLGAGGFPANHSGFAGSGDATNAAFATSSFETDVLSAPALAGAANYDVKYSGTFVSAQQITGGDKLLFEIKFTVPLTATAGVYAVDLVPNALPTALAPTKVIRDNGSPELDISTNNGSIQVLAVPEPSSFGFLVLCASLIGARRRQR